MARSQFVQRGNVGIPEKGPSRTKENQVPHAAGEEVTSVRLVRRNQSQREHRKARLLEARHNRSSIG
ncbi:hypothetical protein CMUS01_00325 [Colletotrichum musicola]|uniref:Uncharacterized protein n=1 Tax=Colletotrichum musicola TaxID=2175873 RepID=A0A8H6NZF4_9PEZI|nr:hypothetical protein CMUS01_00325 [Colletotrichum musicola]